MYGFFKRVSRVKVWAQRFKRRRECLCMCFFGVCNLSGSNGSSYIMRRCLYVLDQLCFQKAKEASSFPFGWTPLPPFPAPPASGGSQTAHLLCVCVSLKPLITKPQLINTWQQSQRSLLCSLWLLVIILHVYVQCWLLRVSFCSVCDAVVFLKPVFSLSFELMCASAVHIIYTLMCVVVESWWRWCDTLWHCRTSRNPTVFTVWLPGNTGPCWKKPTNRNSHASVPHGCHVALPLPFLRG